MSKSLIIVLILAALVWPARAELKFKDLPADHWAAAAVYDLVRLGVTKGYPDGTFRGNNKISRYETAVFLSKLAKAIGHDDLQADIALLKNEVAALKKSGAGLAVAGSYDANWKISDLLAAGTGRGAVANYRLKLSADQELGQGSKVRINFDTMDYGYNNNDTADLAKKLLDIESQVTMDLSALGFTKPVDLQLTYGPGPQQHGTVEVTGLLPSEAGIVYSRPNPGIMATTNLWGLDVAGAYLAKAIQGGGSGRVSVSVIKGAVGYTFGGVPWLNSLKLNLTGDYWSSGLYSATIRDIRGAVALSAPISNNVEASGTVGLSGAGGKNMMIAGKLGLNDILDTGTVALVTVSKIGASYLAQNSAFASAQFDQAGLDAFSRPLVNGTVNIGGELVQSLSDNVQFIGKGDVRLSGDYQYQSPTGRITAQGGISYALAPNTNFDALYRVYQDRAAAETSDLAALGLLYHF